MLEIDRKREITGLEHVASYHRDLICNAEYSDPKTIVVKFC